MSDREMKVDTTKDILNAAEIDALQARCGEYGLPAREACRVLASHAALLAHLDALTAPAVPEGQALGLLAFAAICPEAGVEAARAIWPTLEEGERVAYRAIGTALHAIGYARGVAAGEAERARLTAELASAEQLTAAAVDTSAADRERALNAERERDALAAELARWCKGAGVTSPESLASLLRDNLHAIAAARRDGAREERRLCNAALMMLRQHVSTRAGKRVLEQAILDAESRARGEGQGS